MTADSKGAGPQVAFVATDLSTGGGVNRIIRDLSTVFSERLRCRTIVLNGRSTQQSAFGLSPKVELIDQPDPGRWAYIKSLWALRSSRPDVVIGSWAQDNILLVLVFLFAPTKVILVEHSSWHFHGALVRCLRRLTYPLADALIVLNPSELAYYSRFISDVRIIPNPVAAPRPSAQVSREKQIVAVGHLTDTKNFTDAVQALALAELEADGWSLAIVGTGSSEQSLQSEIERLGLKSTAILPPVGELNDLYQRSSLLLVTSRSESFSLVLAEAMAAGVVPLAYASDGPSFILEDFSELLVEIGDVATLAQRLRALARSGDLEPLRRRLAASIRARFAPGIVVQQWREVLGI